MRKGTRSWSLFLNEWEEALNRDEAKEKDMDRLKESVDVIIPVYKPSEDFPRLLEMLQKQTVSVGKMIVINTERQFWDEAVDERELQEKYSNLVMKHIKKQEFDHGGTRNLGVSLADSPYFVMLTDDAMPCDEYLLQHLLAPFSDPRIKMTYGRQLPSKECGILEEYTRGFNYPENSRKKFAEDIKDMGIKAFFASNVCAAYNRKVFEELGGFISHTIFNEDMIYARKLLDAGYGIGYAADACVIHSHNYSGVQQFHRNFDLGVSHGEHPEVFGGIATESEGIKMVKKTCSYLIKEGRALLIGKLFWQSGCKYAGFFLGKRFKKLPVALVKACSMNKDYWKKQKKQKAVTK